MKTVDASLRRWFTANCVRPTPARRGGHSRPVWALLALAADEILRLHQRLVAAYVDTAPVELPTFQQQVGYVLNFRRHYRHDQLPQPTRNRWPVNRS